jgi:general secretion pathway protein E
MEYEPLSTSPDATSEHASLIHLSESLGIPFQPDLTGLRHSTDFAEQIPIGFARRFGVLAFEGDEDNLDVAISSIESWDQLQIITRYLGKRVQPFLAPSDLVTKAINDAYQQKSEQAEHFIASIDQDGDPMKLLDSKHRYEDLLDSEGKSPVIKLVNLVLFDAVKSDASDVHIQPYEDRVVIRFRIDGVLFDTLEVGKELQEEVISRIKVLGKMDIAEKRLPQDGRTTVEVGDRTVDLRIASLPASHGERVVIRLLDKGARLYTLSEIGMDHETLRRFREIIHLEHGLVLITGPTGSGKTTTLYGALQEINTVDRNVITLEDPIEYQMPGISQSQVNETKGMTFAKGLRNVLRQDPDIIMIGEIRDHETAVMAIQSALTGHLVFSTLHTNDASSAVTRLLELGIEPYLVSSSLLAVMAQRLVRRVCSHCKQERQLSIAELDQLGKSNSTNTSCYNGIGCERCRQTGYRGRKGIFELLVVDDEIRAGIQERANATLLRRTACKNGMSLLREDGIQKIGTGLTSAEEVLRVTMRASV